MKEDENALFANDSPLVRKFLCQFLIKKYLNIYFSYFTTLENYKKFTTQTNFKLHLANFKS